MGGAVGAVVGFAVAWGLGVYSTRLGVSHTHVDLGRWVIGSAGSFAAIGLLFGPVVGTLLGELIGALFAFERGDDIGSGTPSWLKVLLVVALVVGALWYIRHH